MGSIHLITKSSEYIFYNLLERCTYGSIQIKTPKGGTLYFHGSQPGYDADIHFKDNQCYKQFLKNGDIGFGESYMLGLWQSDNIKDVLLYLLDNISVIEDYLHGSSLLQFLLGISKIFTRNSRKGSLKNIHYHYDLSNDFYELWLDPTMSYSSAIFDKNDISLKDAQTSKYQRILNELSFNNGQNVLEIGCGWGGFAHQAGQQNLLVDAITLSKEQAKFTTQRAHDHNLSHNIQVDFRDYRDVHKKYDGIVSIEMFEAVGQEYWNHYFTKIKNCLKENGKAVIQTITIKEDIFKDYAKRTDFIQKHIFPGGMLPSKSIFKTLAHNNKLKVDASFAFGKCYAKTLDIWLNNFNKSFLPIRNLGFDESFIRKWQFYLAYCIAGFTKDRTDVVQFTLSHAQN